MSKRPSTSRLLVNRKGSSHQIKRNLFIKEDTKKVPQMTIVRNPHYHHMATFTRRNISKDIIREEQWNQSNYQFNRKNEGKIIHKGHKTWLNNSRTVPSNLKKEQFQMVSFNDLRKPTYVEIHCPANAIKHIQTNKNKTKKHREEYKIELKYSKSFPLSQKTCFN